MSSKRSKPVTPEQLPEKSSLPHRNCPSFLLTSVPEREIIIQVAPGPLNKQIANDIGIKELTVKVHRTKLMRQMKARSLPDHKTIF